MKLQLTENKNKEYLHLHDDKITVSDIKQIIRKTKSDYSGMEKFPEPEFAE